MIQSTVDEIRARLRAEGWLCLESGDCRRTVTIVARKDAVTVTVPARGREVAWERYGRLDVPAEVVVEWDAVSGECRIGYLAYSVEK
jgi:hypothetical protein